MAFTRLVNGLRRRGHIVSMVRPRQHARNEREQHDPAVTLVAGVPLPGYQTLRVGAPADRRKTDVGVALDALACGPGVR